MTSFLGVDVPGWLGMVAWVVSHFLLERWYQKKQIALVMQAPAAGSDSDDDFDDYEDDDGRSPGLRLDISSNQLHAKYRLVLLGRVFILLVLFFVLPSGTFLPIAMGSPMVKLVDFALNLWGILTRFSGAQVVRLVKGLLLHKATFWAGLMVVFVGLAGLWSSPPTKIESDFDGVDEDFGSHIWDDDKQMWVRPPSSSRELCSTFGRYFIIWHIIGNIQHILHYSGAMKLLPRLDIWEAVVILSRGVVLPLAFGNFAECRSWTFWAVVCVETWNLVLTLKSIVVGMFK